MSFSNLLANYAAKKLAPPVAVIAKQADYVHPSCIELEKIWESSKSDPNETSSGDNLCDVPTTIERNIPYLVVLLIIIDDLPHETLWRLWAEQYDVESVKREANLDISKVEGDADLKQSINSTEHVVGDETSQQQQSHCVSAETISNTDSTQPLPEEIRSKSDVKESSSSRVRFLIHAKQPDRVKSAWVRERLVSFHLRPNWGSLELTEVMVRMLDEAVSTIPSATNFSFASESCIPIQRLNDILKMLEEDNNSWIKYQRTANNGYATQYQFGALKGFIPEHCIFKADQWLQLTRTHAKAVLTLANRVEGNLLHLFKKVKASDEMYFPCCLAVLGAIPCEDPGSARTPTTPSVTLSNPLPPSTSHTATKSSIQECSTINLESTTNNTETPKNENEVVNLNDVKFENLKLDAVSSRQMTYCVWGQGDKNPKTFSSLTPDIITAAKSQKSIFLRKFVLPSNQTVDDNDRKQRQNRGRNSNNRGDWNDDEGDVSTVEVEKKILLRVWLSLVLQLPNNSGDDNNDNIDKSEKRKGNNAIDENDKNDVSDVNDNDENDNNDGKEDKVIKSIDEKETDIDSINNDITEIDEDKKNNNDDNNDINFDFNYCLLRFDLFSAQNKEKNDQYRNETYERKKIENEARNETNHDRRECSPRESGRPGRSGSHRDQDNDRPGRSNSHRDQDNGRDSYHDSDRNGNDQNRSSDANSDRYRNSDYNNSNNNNRYDNDNNNNYYSNRNNNYNNNNRYNNNYNDRDYKRNDDRNRDRDRQRNDEDNYRERNNTDEIENNSNKKRKIDDENALPIDSDVAVEVLIDGKMKQQQQFR